LKTRVICVPDGYCIGSDESSQHGTMPGWTIGGGLEYRFVGQFIFRAEYRYSDYFNHDVSFFQPSDVGPLGIRATLHTTTQLAYFGVSYLWGPLVRTGRGGGGGEE